MRRYVNGVETTLTTDLVAVRPEGDLFWVETEDGPRSAVGMRVGESILISFRGRQYTIEARDRNVAAAAAGLSGEIRAPMPGQIVDIRVGEGETVAAGMPILILEAMKTQQPLISPFFGQVSSLKARKGDQVQDGDLLAVVERRKTSTVE